MRIVPAKAVEKDVVEKDSFELGGGSKGKKTGAGFYSNRGTREI